MRSIWHPYTAWECFHAGMFAECEVELEAGKAMYAEFLSDADRFGDALARVVLEWPISCEHFLTKQSMNRVAWLGQASMCIATGLSRKYRGGFHLMTAEQRTAANEQAQRTLTAWEHEHEKKIEALYRAMAEARLRGWDTGGGAAWRGGVRSVMEGGGRGAAEERYEPYQFRLFASEEQMVYGAEEDRD